MFKFDEVRELSEGVAPAGWHNVTITKIEKRTSSSGNDMLVFTYTIDVGENALIPITDYIVFSDQNQIGLRKIKTIANKTGIELQNCNSLGDIVKQFPYETQRLRMKVFVEHQYSILVNNSWKNVDQEEWDAFEPGESEGKNVNAGVRRYRPADAVPTVKIGDTSDPAKDNDEDEYDLDEDDLPF